MTANLTNETQFDAIIIGAGACGLMCAVQAGLIGRRTLIMESNSRAGAKILISGGGRCNYTNLYSTDEQFLSANPHFSKSAFAQWTVEDTISFFSAYGIEGKEKTLGQLFPVSDKARDVVNVFTDACEQLGQQIWLDCPVKQVDQQPGGFLITYERNGRQQKIAVPKVVIATGGLPVQKLGASDFALRLAKKLDIPVVPTAPALVPLTITGKEQAWYQQLSGNSVFCRVWNERISFEENLLFTHWGLSGPAILQISSYWQPGEWLYVDLLPQQNIVTIIENQRVQNGKKSLLSLLAGLYTRKFAEALGYYLPVSKNLAMLNKGDMQTIEQLIHQFKVKPAGDKGYDRAEVMRGGIDTAAISSKTLETKKVPGLYFGGECLDVTGWLGGYNFQWAWACGYIIAQQL